MTIETPKISADDLTTILIIELLVSPEHGMSWIEETAKSFDLELTDGQLETVDGEVSGTLHQLAIPFIESLPEPLHSTYRELMEKIESRAYPLGEGHGRDIEL